MGERARLTDGTVTGLRDRGVAERPAARARVVATAGTLKARRSEVEPPESQPLSPPRVACHPGEAAEWLASSHEAPFTLAAREALAPCLLGRFHLMPNMRIYDEGDTTKRFFVVVSGWACQYRIVAGGERLIRKFALPGDLLGLRPDMPELLDHAAASLTAAELWAIDGVLAARVAANRIEVMRDLGAYALREEALAWDRFTCVARAAAIERVARLLYGLCSRLGRHAPQNGDVVALPLTQEQIGDAVGLSAVHVNRMLAELRRSGILKLYAGRLVIRDTARFAMIAGRNF